MTALQMVGKQHTLLETLGAVTVMAAVITVVVLLLRRGE